MGIRFQLELSSRQPIYRQVIDQIYEGIARGKLVAGDRLPTVRQLSAELLVNQNTIARAYAELEREGVTFTRRGVGVFVAEKKNTMNKGARRQLILDQIDLMLTGAVRMGFQEDELLQMVTERLGRFKWDQVEINSRSDG